MSDKNRKLNPKFTIDESKLSLNEIDIDNFDFIRFKDMPQYEIAEFLLKITNVRSVEKVLKDLNIVPKNFNALTVVISKAMENEVDEHFRQKFNIYIHKAIK